MSKNLLFKIGMWHPFKKSVAILLIFLFAILYCDLLFLVWQEVTLKRYSCQQEDEVSCLICLIATDGDMCNVNLADSASEAEKPAGPAFVKCSSTITVALDLNGRNILPLTKALPAHTTPSFVLLRPTKMYRLLDIPNPVYHPPPAVNGQS